MEKVNVNGVQIAYNRTGSGKPLVLVHGYPLDHTTWNEVVPLLKNDFDLILPDLRGFGQSDVVELQYKIVDMAADINSLLDHLGIEKTAIAGHSMGGYVALAFVRAYVERTLGLGLVSSQAPNDSPERKQGRYEAAAEVMKSGVKPVADSMSAKLSPDERVQAFVRDLIAAQRPAGLAGALKAMAERVDSTSDLYGFQFPVVLVHGEADELIPIQRAREIKAAIPNATLIELPGIGHMPMMENPQATASTLKKML
ncbi:MAG: alpha/beta hydrolase [Anaerolineales bacterium]|jgi:pimeloyl-ACP methyl ester carboxylesterase